MQAKESGWKTWMGLPTAWRAPEKEKVTLGRNATPLAIPGFQRILLAVDGSPASQEATAWASALARRFNASVTALGVALAPGLSLPWGDGVEHSSFREGLIQESRDDAQATLDATAAMLRRQKVSVKTILATGSPAREVLATARRMEADLVVMGARGNDLSWPMGSTAERVKHHARCSLLLVRNGPPPNHVVAGADGSRTGALAVRVALRLGALFDCPTTVVHTHAAPRIGTARRPTMKDPVVADLEAAHPMELMRGRLRFVFRIGEPEDALEAVAAEESAGLLVLGSRGLGTVRGRLMGSVGDAVSRQAKRSVLLVHS